MLPLLADGLAIVTPHNITLTVLTHIPLPRLRLIVTHDISQYYR